MPINRRPFNTVFQDYALFPHLTVAGNVGYGLVGARHVQRTEIAQPRRARRSNWCSSGVSPSAIPAQLSGGQRQRVALARAIICQPRLILLDEPLAALDVELRRQMQVFLKSIQREIRTTFLFVTHDQEEAIAMADRICVMNAGHIRQIGTPHEVYYRPNCEFVARFFGENNLMPGTLGPVQGDAAIDRDRAWAPCSAPIERPAASRRAGRRRRLRRVPARSLASADATDSGNRFAGTHRGPWPLPARRPSPRSPRVPTMPRKPAAAPGEPDRRQRAHARRDGLARACAAEGRLVPA